jgi:hypothetical protein
VAPIIRAPVELDAERLGGVHVRARQAACRDVMPDEYLDGLQATEWAKMWRRAITARQSDRRLTVVEEGGRVAGVAASAGHSCTT